MARLRVFTASAFSAICGLLIFLAVPGCLVGEEPSPRAVAAFNAYIRVTEAHLAEQRQSQSEFLAPTATIRQNQPRLRSGDLIVEQLTPTGGMKLPGALLHHWRGTAFVPGVTASDFEHLMKDFSAYSQIFSPQVLQAKLLMQRGSQFEIRMRVSQRHVIPVVMDITDDVTFERPSAGRGYSISRSVHISEIESAGTRSERTLNSSGNHGFLWRQNTYWSYQQRDGGLVMQIDSVSLSRSIPPGLGWVVRPFVESVPRDSLEFTLHAICDALRKQARPVPAS